LRSANWRPDRFTPTSTPARAPAAHFAERPFADPQDQPGVLGELDELGRRHETARAVLPAQQPLVAGHPPARELDHRLVEHAQLAVLDRAAQVRLERHPPGRGEVHLLGEELVVGAPGLLGVVHRRIGIADQGFGIATVVREDADADRGRDLEVALVHRHRLRHRLDDLLRHVREVRQVLEFG